MTLVLIFVLDDCEYCFTKKKKYTHGLLCFYLFSCKDIILQIIKFLGSFFFLYASILISLKWLSYFSHFVWVGFFFFSSRLEESIHSPYSDNYRLCTGASCLWGTLNQKGKINFWVLQKSSRKLVGCAKAQLEVMKVSVKVQEVVERCLQKADQQKSEMWCVSSNRWRGCPLIKKKKKKHPIFIF